MPRRANMKMKRMRRTSRALIDAIEFTRDFTRFPIDDQYLRFLNIIAWRISSEQNTVLFKKSNGC
jgi:hypothetical protein